MQVTVIMPVRNGERTIRESIASALAQTHRDFELLVVDDGSTDNSRAVAAGTPDPRVRLLPGERRGVSAARNRGIEASRGELVAFLDADDLWRPDKLERQVAAFARDPRLGAAYCWLDVLDPGAERPRVGMRETHHGDVYRALLAGNIIGNGSNLMARRSALDAVGGFDEDLEGAEDWELAVRLAARHPFACIEAPLVIYRQTPGSLSSDLPRLERSFRLAVERVFASAPRECSPLQRQVEITFYQWVARRECRRIDSRRRALTALNCLRKAALSYTPGGWRPTRAREFLADCRTALAALAGLPTAYGARSDQSRV